MITKENALSTLRPGAQWTTRGDVIEWPDSEQTQPTEEEINAEISRLQAEHDAQEYARSRASAYAPIGDQLDMQYHDQQDGTTTWTDHVAEIKARFPK